MMGYQVFLTTTFLTSIIIALFYLLAYMRPLFTQIELICSSKLIFITLHKSIVTSSRTKQSFFCLKIWNVSYFSTLYTLIIRTAIRSWPKFFTNLRFPIAFPRAVFIIGMFCPLEQFITNWAIPKYRLFSLFTPIKKLGATLGTKPLFPYKIGLFRGKFLLTLYAGILSCSFHMLYYNIFSKEANYAL